MHNMKSHEEAIMHNMKSHLPKMLPDRWAHQNVCSLWVKKKINYKAALSPAEASF